MRTELTGEVAHQYIGAWMGARGGLDAQALSRDACAAMHGGRSAMERLRLGGVWVVRRAFPSSRCRAPVTSRKRSHRPARRRSRAPTRLAKSRLGRGPVCPR